MKAKTDNALILKLHGEGKGQRKIAKQLGCSKTAVLKRLRKLLPDGGHQIGARASMVTRENLPTTPRYLKTVRYLRKINTREIFVFNEYICGRADMEEVRWTGERFEVVTKFAEREPNKT
jgi:biotin operon repressor